MHALQICEQQNAVHVDPYSIGLLTPSAAVPHLLTPKTVQWQHFSVELSHTVSAGHLLLLLVDHPRVGLCNQYGLAFLYRARSKQTLR